MKVIIIGGSTGIGRAIAIEFLSKGYKVGITARRGYLLKEIQDLYPMNCIIQEMDVKDVIDSMEKLNKLIQLLGGLDIFIYNAGVGHARPTIKEELDIIDVNIMGFTALTRKVLDYFIKAGSGQVVGVSSLVPRRGTRLGTAYSASKSYISTYLGGIRHYCEKNKLNIKVTDIKPGFVDTALTDSIKRHYKPFWVAPVEKAARQIRRAIEKKQKKAFVSRRWVIVSWLLFILPDKIYFKI